MRPEDYLGGPPEHDPFQSSLLGLLVAAVLAVTVWGIAQASVMPVPVAWPTEGAY